MNRRRFLYLGGAAALGAALGGCGGSGSSSDSASATRSVPRYRVETITPSYPGSAMRFDADANLYTQPLGSGGGFFPGSESPPRLYSNGYYIYDRKTRQFHQAGQPGFFYRRPPEPEAVVESLRAYGMTILPPNGFTPAINPPYFFEPSHGELNDRLERFADFKFRGTTYFYYEKDETITVLGGLGLEEQGFSSLRVRAFNEEKEAIIEAGDSTRHQLFVYRVGENTLRPIEGGGVLRGYFIRSNNAGDLLAEGYYDEQSVPVGVEPPKAPLLLVDGTPYFLTDRLTDEWKDWRVTAAGDISNAREVIADVEEPGTGKSYAALLLPV